MLSLRCFPFKQSIVHLRGAVQLSQPAAAVVNKNWLMATPPSGILVLTMM